MDTNKAVELLLMVEIRNLAKQVDAIQTPEDFREALRLSRGLNKILIKANHDLHSILVRLQALDRGVDTMTGPRGKVL